MQAAQLWRAAHPGGQVTARIGARATPLSGVSVSIAARWRARGPTAVVIRRHKLAIKGVPRRRCDDAGAALCKLGQRHGRGCVGVSNARSVPGSRQRGGGFRRPGRSLCSSSVGRSTRSAARIGPGTITSTASTEAERPWTLWRRSAAATSDCSAGCWRRSACCLTVGWRGRGSRQGCDSSRSEINAAARHLCAALRHGPCTERRRERQPCRDRSLPMRTSSDRRHECVSGRAGRTASFA